MSNGALNCVLFLVFLGTLGLLWMAERDPAERNFDFLPNMVRSVASDTYSPSAQFADGKTLQLPQPGTIPRGLMPLHYRTVPEDAVRAGTELRNPFTAADAHARARGEFIFANYCKICHGPEGKGDGLLAQRGIPPPAALVAPKTVQLKDGQLFHILTYGQGNMPSHATQLAREDRWKVILHIRSLQRRSVAEKQR
jgi:mono/diheme cytochrome c family protein